MSSDWYEKHLTSTVKQLEETRTRLRDEIEKLQNSKKPDVNRMVAEKLNTTTSGCNCQRMLLILVQDGEVKSWEQLTPDPHFLREVREEEPNYSRDYWIEAQKNGEAFYRDRSNHYWEERDFDEKLTHIKRSAQLVPTIQINGKYYTEDPCDYAGDVTGESFDSYSCPDEIKELPNGIYQVLHEQACYSYTTAEGTEGDSDFDYKLYNSVPLWEFLKCKDSLLAEAEPEAEELVDTYVYIQQTKQYRFKENTPKQFVEGKSELPWDEN